MFTTFEALLSQLVARGREAAAAEGIPTDSSGTSAPTSIRLKPSTRLFIEKQAEALSTSQQSVITMILDGVAEATSDPVAGTLRTMRERFFHVFNAHKLDLPGIVSVMSPMGFKLSDLSNSNRMLDLLDRKVLQHLAQTFFVQIEWVSGASDFPVSTGNIDVRWYKNIPSVAWRLLHYCQSGLRPHVMFIRREKANFKLACKEEDKVDAEPIGVVVRLQRCTEDGVNFVVYEVWEFERWNYWRCRQQIKHLIAFCDEAREKGLINFAGYELESDKLALLEAGRILPVTVLDRLNASAWYPEDYASLTSQVTEESYDWAQVQKTYTEGSVGSILETYMLTGNVQQ